jgi:hypothetical protein
VYEPHRELICAFCCGKLCKHENWRVQNTGLHNGYPAVKGLNSSWITPNILAMQRPSSILLAKYNIVQQFLLLNIGAIFNLQMIGEHAQCGDGIHPEGFSYLAEEFMSAGIMHYNPSWVDMSVPSLSKMLDIVQIMEFNIKGTHSRKPRSVAVHCHAGLGRTGIVIACYLVYAAGMSTEDAIQLVRTKRPGSVQTATQVQFVNDFYLYIKQRCTIFQFVPSTARQFGMCSCSDVDLVSTDNNGVPSSPSYPQSISTSPGLMENSSASSVESYVSDHRSRNSIPAILRRQNEILHGIVSKY